MTNSILSITFFFLMGALFGQGLLGGLAGYLKTDCENKLHGELVIYSCEFVKKIVGD